MDEEETSIDKWFKKKITITAGLFFIVSILLLLCFIVINSITNRSVIFSSDKDTTGLKIESLIREVKTELMKADTERINNNENALFRLKSFQMEISFTVKKTNKANTKLGYDFVSVEGGSESGNEKVQKLILNWDAIPQKDTVKEVIGDTNEIFIKKN